MDKKLIFLGLTLLVLAIIVFLAGSSLDRSVSSVAWESSAGHNKVRLRGHTYEQDDVLNLLPGGHGNLLLS